MRKPELQRLLDLQTFLLQLHTTERVVHHPGSKSRLETDTEHSFSLAMTAWYLSRYFPELQQDRVLRVALVHDLVEIYAGDTFLYGDQASLDSKAQREKLALERIEKEWADFPDMLQAIHQYEARKTGEATFVYALDKLMPILMIFLGKGYTWQQEKITLDMLMKSKSARVSVSPEINSYYNKLIELLREHQHYFGKS